MKIIDNNTSVWEHRYRPQCVEDLVIPYEFKESLQKAVNSQDIPNFGLFSFTGGTGKTSTATAIVKEIGGEALWVNASMEKGIDVIRTKIQRFASQNSFDDNIKIVVMDEFDNFSPDGQKAFRGFLDEFSINCRFIFTGNYKEKIIPQFLERLEQYDFNYFNKREMIKPIFERLKFILNNEGIHFNEKDLVPIINTFYPSIRSMVVALQKFSRSGTLQISKDELDDANAFDEVMNMLRGNYTDLITSVNNLNGPDNMYSYLYNNGAKYFKPIDYPKMVLIIAKYQHMSSTVRDKNLNLSACLTELMGLQG